MGHDGRFAAGTFSAETVSKQLQAGLTQNQFDDQHKELTQFYVIFADGYQLTAFSANHTYITGLMSNAVKNITIDRNKVADLARERPF